MKCRCFKNVYPHLTPLVYPDDLQSHVFYRVILCVFQRIYFIGFAENISKDRQYKSYCLISNKSDSWKVDVRWINAFINKCMQSYFKILNCGSNNWHQQLKIRYIYYSYPETLGVLVSALWYKDAWVFNFDLPKWDLNVKSKR